MNKKIVVVWLVVVLLLAAALPAMARDTPPEDAASIPDAALDTPRDFVRWLSVGAAPFIGAAVTFLARRSVWFQALPSDKKRAVAFGLGVGLPSLAGFALLYIPEHVWLALLPAWQIVVPALLGWVGLEASYLGLVRDRA